MTIIKNPPSPMPDEDVVIPVTKRKTVTTLASDDCRWPIGDPQTAGFHFCGKHKQPGHPYCPQHVRRASTPGRPRNLLRRRDVA